MSKIWFEDYQQQWQDWQNQWIDAWKNSIPDVKDLPDASEMFGKALEAQEEAVKASFKIQQDAIDTATKLQKQWSNTYFDTMKQMPLVANK